MNRLGSVRLRTRIALAFALLLLAVQATGLVVLNTVLSRGAQNDIEQKLVVGQRIFDQLHEDNGRQLAQAARILSSDFAFREAVATHDRATIISALQNQGARINADITMLAGLDNVTVADTLDPGRTGQPFPFAKLASIAQGQGQATAIVLIDGKAYELALVPVLAPVPVAWLAMGFVIDDKFARRLRQLTLLEVSFWRTGNGTREGALLATTLPADKQTALATALKDSLPASGATATLRVANDVYVTAVSSPTPQDRDVVRTVLQMPLDAQLAPLRQVQATLVALSVLSLLGTLIASVLIARGMTRPLSALSRAAQKIEQGDYSVAVDIDQQDEIGQLASAFNHMRQGIAAREAKIGDMAYRDLLTGLPNRALFQDRLEQAIKGSRRGNVTPTILIMDLDRFKDVNDSLGHHVGDLLLQKIAQRCQTALLRDTDTVARLGGDEFAVLLPDGDAQGAQVVARKLLSVVEEPTLLEGQQVVVGGSIGIASYPMHGDELHTLLRHADMAMYAAKRSHGGFAVYDSRYDQQAQQRLSLMAELRNAVEQDQLVLHYQPKIDLATHEIREAEALVRWVHPERGFVPPDEFIPFAEHTGYIKAITGWVIHRALRQLDEWRSEGLRINVSVNISARDLLNPELPELFAGLVNHPSLPFLSLEITESGIMSDAGHALGVLEYLRSIGLRLSIDDFGTGYSSLSYLKRLPVDELKIDKSFVTDMAKDRDDATIVRSTIDLGHNMGLKVVAEGVENQESWDMLAAWGCDLAQGYFISRPLTAEKLVEWVMKARAEDAETV